jgi:hypothetical protein
MYCRILMTMQPDARHNPFFKDWNLQIRVSKSNSNKFEGDLGLWHRHCSHPSGSFQGENVESRERIETIYDRRD